MQVHPTEIEQPQKQRVWMIGLLSDPHCGFAMSDGLIEPAEHGKRDGKRVRKGRRLDRWRSETLSAQLAVESDVPLEQFDYFAVLAPSDVRVAKIGCCDHLEEAIAERTRDGERFLPEFESCIVVASGPTLHDHEGGDPPEPVLIAERLGECLRLLEVIQHACPIAQRD